MPNLEDLTDKYQDILECCEDDDWTTKNLVQEFLEDLQCLVS